MKNLDFLKSNTKLVIYLIAIILVIALIFFITVSRKTRTDQTSQVPNQKVSNQKPLPSCKFYDLSGCDNEPEHAFWQDDDEP